MQFDLGLSLAHLAIAVESLGDASELYAALGFTLDEPEIIASQHVRAQVACKEGLRIELLEDHPPGKGSIAKFIEKRGPGLHHIALRSIDLESDLKLLAAKGIDPLPGYPADGLADSRIAFLDPKTTGGVLIELVAEQKRGRVKRKGGKGKGTRRMDR